LLESAYVQIKIVIRLTLLGRMARLLAIAAGKLVGARVGAFGILDQYGNGLVG
jgi:hypothetical protein